MVLLSHTNCYRYVLELLTTFQTLYLYQVHDSSVAEERFLDEERGRKYKIKVSFYPQITKHLHQPKMFNGSTE